MDDTVYARSSDIGNDQIAEQQETRSARVGNGLAIRDDGILVPSTPDILKQQNIRPYHGDPNWTLEQRLDWLAGRPVRGTAAASEHGGELGANSTETRVVSEPSAELKGEMESIRKKLLEKTIKSVTPRS